MYLSFIFKILLAMLLGFLIGLERELTGHRVGIRINVLICMGVSFFTALPMLNGRPEAFRLGASIISGVGFLCSAVIFKGEGEVKGINTAATLWCTAAIGLLVGSSNFLYPIIASIILIGSNLLLRPLSRKIKPILGPDDLDILYEISVTCLDKSEYDIRNELMRQACSSKLFLKTIESSDVIGGKVEVKARLLAVGKARNHLVEEICSNTLKNTNVISAGWEVINN